MRLRSYQQEAVDQSIRSFEKGENFVLLQAATGSGKTIIFSHLIKKMLWEGLIKNVAIVAHRRELIAQARDKMLSVDPEADIGLACSSLQRKRELNHSITIGTIQTLSNLNEVDSFDLVIIDEVHRLPPKNKSSQMGNFLKQAQNQNPNFKVLGVTATPYRLGHGYIFGTLAKDPEANWFQKKTYSIGIDQLQKEGFLCPYTYLVADQHIHQDLNQVSVNSFGEFQTNALEATVTKKEHLLSAVKTLQSQALDRKSIVIFCVSIPHAERLKETFNEHGIICESIHSEMKTQERDEILEQFNQGQIRILTNVNVLTEGWDSPRADCVMLCRPTLSAALYVQMVGRGLRKFEGKRDCLILDLANCFQLHGSIKHPIVKHHCDEVETNSNISRERHCPECLEIIPLSTLTCPYCSMELKSRVLYIDDEMEMVSIDEGSDHVTECDVCQIPFRYNELHVEWMSDNPHQSPMGLIYCPEDHLIKAMNPAQPLEKNGEYDWVQVHAEQDEENTLTLRLIFLDLKKDPFYTHIHFKDGQTDTLQDWLPKDIRKELKLENVESCLKQLHHLTFEKPYKVQVTVANDGCLLKF